MTPTEVYQGRVTLHRAARERYATRSRRISYWRIATFLGSAACLVAALLPSALQSAPFYIASPILFVAFLALVAHHATVDNHEQRHAAFVSLNELALAKLRRDWNAVPVPQCTAPPNHPYAEDLDIFGRASLFALLWNGGTAMAQERLADWLLAPAPAEQVRQRHEAVAELAPLLDFRQQLLAVATAGTLHAHDVPRFLAWAEGRPWLSPHRVVTWTIRATTAVIFGLITLQILGVVAWAYWLIPVVLVFIASNLMAARVAHIFDAAFAHQAVFRHYAELFRLVSAADLRSSLLRDLQAALMTEHTTASRQMKRLDRLMQLADLRLSALIHLPVQLLTLWDFHVVLLVERWQRHAGRAARGWFDALATFEALATLAALRYDNPDWALADVDPAARAFEATALAHPLLPAGVRVNNDVRVGPAGTFLLVTGSNMSGKSTLLRAIGVNAVLAEAGAPVCASALAMPPVRLHTSMRVQDSLEQGVSFFMAAVKRLKQVVEAAEPATRVGRDGEGAAPGAPVILLYLLDEVLQGTNTAERQIAVRSILRHLLHRPAIGAVTTHDLSLADTPDLAGAADAVHFTEHLEGTGGRQSMSFDYRLRPGIATSRNAIKLMQMVGHEVDNQHG